MIERQPDQLPAPQGVVAIDRAQRIVFFDAGAERLYGHTAAGVMGQPIETLIPARFRERHRANVAGFFASGQLSRPMSARGPVLALRADGSEVPVQVTLLRPDPKSPRSHAYVVVQEVPQLRPGNGRPEAWAVLGKTLAERNAEISRLGTALQEELERREQAEAHARQMAAIVAGSQDAIIATRPDGDITSWNPGAERLYGYTAAEVIGRSILVVVPEPLREEARRYLARVAAGEVIANLETERRGKNGEPLVVSLALSPVRDEGGAITGIAAIARDLTRLREAEREAREKTLELEKAAELERVRADFVDAVSHELRTPITNVRGFGELLRDGLGGPLNERQLGYVRRILAGATEMQRLVDDMLEVTRIQAGLFAPIPKDIDLAELVRETVGGVEVLLGDADVKATVEVAPGDTHVSADERRVCQVVANLLANAIKFSPRGGTIGLRVLPAADEVRVEVTDEGPGIAPEDVPRLFQRFGQLEAGRRQGGTGLGLWIARTIVEAHGGRIGIDSTPGRGSTFWLALPRRPR